MEKLITIDGKEMRMVANGATIRIYRMLFGEDLLRKMQALHKKVEGDKSEIGADDAEVLENLAYVLGRQGGSIPKDMDLMEWLGTLEDPFAIWAAAQDITTLWLANQKTVSTPKKKSAKQTAN